MKRLAIVLALGCVAVAACQEQLTPADYADIGSVAATIAKCQAEGYACKADGGDHTACCEVYAQCMNNAGLEGKCS